MSHDETQTLLKKRSIVKGQLTRFKKYLDKIDTNPTTLKQDYTIVNELKLRCSKFNSLLDDFNEIQDQIELIDGGEEAVSECNERELFENNFYSLQAIAELCDNDANNTIILWKF